MRRLKFTYRLLLSFLFLGIFTFSIITFYSYFLLKNTKEKDALLMLKAVTQVKKQQLEKYLENKQNDAKTLANSLSIRQLTNQLIAYQEFASIEPHEPFYVSTNEWQNIYNKFKGEFKEIIDIKNNYDVLIINSNGQIMFSAKKEKSLGENLKTGRLKATFLADLWRSSQKTPKTLITDYFYFTPTNNKIFYFIGVPILDYKQKPLATLVFQISPDEIIDITTPNTEEYNDYELLLIGADFYLRNNKLSQRNSILKAKFKNDHIENAFTKKETSFVTDDSKGKELLTASATLNFGNQVWLLMATLDYTKMTTTSRQLLTNLVIILSILLIILLIPVYFFSKLFFATFTDVKDVITKLTLGAFPSNSLSIRGNQEVIQIKESLKKLIEGLKKTTQFAIKIKDNKLDSDFVPLSKEDKLGNALLTMKQSLLSAREEEGKRKKEDELRNWANEGYSILSDILRQFTGDINGLADKIIQTTISYLNINQGGIYIINNDEPPALELLASYAYDKKKFINKKIEIGEGLIGMCGLEKATIYIKEVPEDYIEITSGLGQAVPKALLITPLIHEAELMGVIELASFDDFKDYEITFLEKIGENIASSLANAKVNYRTRILLDETRKQSEEMAAQEEEMRQNLEEMQATREESARKEQEMSSILEAVDNTSIRCEIDENGIFIYLNDEFEKTIGFSRSETIGAFAHSILAKNNKKEFDRIWNIVIAGNTHENISKTTTKKGNDVWLLSSYTPVYEDDTNDLSKIIFLANDITQYKKNEEEISQQAEMLKAQEVVLKESLTEMQHLQHKTKEKEVVREAFKSASEDLILYAEIDTSGKISSTNELFADELNLPSKKLSDHNFKDLIAPSSADIFDKTWQNVCTGKYCKEQITLLTKEKITVQVQSSFYPLSTEKGQLIKILFFAINKSEEEKAKKAIEKQTSELKQQEDILTQSIDDLKALQERTNKEIGELKSDNKELSANVDECKKNIKLQLEESNSVIEKKQKEIENLQNQRKQQLSNNILNEKAPSEVTASYIEWLKNFIGNDDTN